MSKSDSYAKEFTYLSYGTYKYVITYSGSRGSEVGSLVSRNVRVVESGVEGSGDGSQELVEFDKTRWSWNCEHQLCKQNYLMGCGGRGLKAEILGLKEKYQFLSF